MGSTMLGRMRWIVGDLQGCAAEFDDLLVAIDFDATRDELWIAGDLVNRGPASLATLRRWQALGAHAVLGNHDLYALATWQGRRPRTRDTLDALFAAEDREALLERLAACPSLVFLASGGLGPDVWLVHAGVHPRWCDLPAVAARLNCRDAAYAWLEDPDVGYAATVRCCSRDGAAVRGSGPTCAAGTVGWDTLYRGDTLVVHGHWATRGHYRGARTLGLDSGCVYGGPLSAWCQDQNRMVQVPSRQPRR